MTAEPTARGPICQFETGCHRVLPCKPGCGAPAAPLPADRAALRDRIAEAQYAHDHPGHLVPLDQTGMGPAYREAADAVMAVLPDPTDRAAVLREAEAEAERQLATVQRVRHVLETEPVLNRTALEYRGLIISTLMPDEARP